MYGGDNNIAILRTANQRSCFLVFRRDDDRFVSFIRMDKGNLESSNICFCKLLYDDLSL